MDVFQILIFLAIIGLGLFKAKQRGQSQKTRRRVVRKTVPVDPFPMDAEEDVPEEVRMTPPPEVQRKKHVEKPKRKESKEKQVPVKGQQPKKERSDYAFHTPSDARRAFIYSEIFRRKYD